MLAQVARETEQLFREVQQLPDLQAVDRQADLLQTFLLDILAIPPDVSLGDRVDDFQREAQGLADTRIALFGR